MNRAHSFLIGFATMTLSTVISAAPTTHPDLVAENERLRERVQKLEQRVKVLQRELELRQWSRPFSLVPAPAPQPPQVPQVQPFSWSVPQRYPDANPVPLNWVPKQFNGDTYYLIPLRDPGNNALIDDRPR